MGSYMRKIKNDSVHLCVVAFRPAVAGPILSPNKVVGAEELAVRRSLDEVIILIQLMKSVFGGQI